VKMRELQPGSPEAARRDVLLAIMRDETRPKEERIEAAIAALPLCHEEAPPRVVVTINREPRRNGR
jgi:hypothetical protein